MEGDPAFEIVGYGGEDPDEVMIEAPAENLPPGQDREPETPLLSIIEGRTEARPEAEPEPDDTRTVDDLVDPAQLSIPEAEPAEDNAPWAGEAARGVDDLLAPEPDIQVTRIQEIIDSKLGPGAFDQMDEETFAGLERAIEIGKSEGIEPEDVTRFYVAEVQKQYKEITRDQRIEALERGFDPEAAAEAAERERVRAEVDEWAANTQAALDVGYQDAMVRLEEQGGKRIDGVHFFSRMNALGLLGTVPVEQAIRLTLADFACAGDPWKAFAPKPPAAHNGGTIEGKGPRARYVFPIPSGVTAPNQPRTVDDLLSE